MSQLLARGTRARSLAIGVALFAALLVVTQLVLPGHENDPRGTPAAILFFGAVNGALIAMTAVGIVLIYRTSRIINFAQTAIGAAGAALTFEFMKYTSVPFPVAFALGLGLAALVGLVFELVVVRRFFDAPRLVLTVATIIMAQVLAQAGTPLVRKLPWFPDDKARAALDTDGRALTQWIPLRGWHFTVGHLPIQFNFSHVFALEVAAVSFLGLAAFFHFTRAGVGVRALAENADRATMLGISVGMLSSIVWVVAGVLSGASVVADGLVSTPGAASGLAPSVLLVALAAAVVGRMESLPITVATCIGLSVLGSAISWSIGSHPGIEPLAYLLVTAVALLLQRNRFRRSEESGGVSFRTTEEVRPIPTELTALASVRWSRRAVVALALLGVCIYPFLVSTGAQNLGSVIALKGIVAVSLVLLVGWAGQVSLGQFAFAAVGAVVGGAVTSRAGWPFWVALPVGAVVAGALALLVGIPALRIKGLFLMVVTFGFAVVVQLLLFDKSYFDWLLPKDIERPRLFFVDFADERSMYFLCLAALVLTVVMTLNLRRSRFGRLLIAARDNEANVQSFGVSVVRLKLTAFMVSGAMCGFAGAIYAHQQLAVSLDNFPAGESINLFLLAVIGGITSIPGVLIGSAYFSIVNYFFKSNIIVAFLGPFATILVLYISPGGIAALLSRVRDSLLRIVAQRRQIVVPSLFADVDPEALANRLIPLAEAAPGSGLNALPGDQRFSMRSELYQGPGERVVDKLGPAKSSKEAAAIGAAAESTDREPVGTSGGTP